MGSGPLDHPLLLEIEERLDRAEIDNAQRLLAELGDLHVHRVAITYFATRILYQRGRLDAAGVVERLRELLLSEPYFPQASAMLSAAELGTLQPDRDGFLRATMDPAHKARARRLERAAEHAPEQAAPVELRLTSEPDTEHDQLQAEGPPLILEPPLPRYAPRRGMSMPEIPRAPMVPRFTPAANPAPSYAPGARSASLQFEFELDLPHAPLELEPSSEPATARGAALSFSPETARVPDSAREPLTARDAGTSLISRSLHDTLRQSEPEPPPSSSKVSRAPLSEREPITVRDGRDARALREGPETMLERARTLWDQGVRERALGHVSRLEHAPLLDPELRAECARFLIEAGEPERALLQARHASQDDPDSAQVLLMLAWSLIRAARRAPNRDSIDEAEGVLLRLRAKSRTASPLSQALRAAVLSETGNPERAIAAATLALETEPTALDAEAAMSLSLARLGRMREAEASWQRLRELSFEEAESLSDRLQQLGVPLGDSGPAPQAALRIWDKVEVELFNGAKELAIATFERGAARELRGLVGESATDAIPLLATMAAAFFTTEPIWRHFAPFDLSLGSIARVEAVLDILYGRAPRGPLVASAYPAQVMLASYVGECLRQGYGGTWLGSLAVAETVFVDAPHTRFAPFHELRQRLEQGKPLLFEGSQGRKARASGAPIAMPVAPPAPWDPAPWPNPRMLPKLGLAFSQSVVNLYCSEFGGGPLDRSPVGLHSLDSYVQLLSPPHGRTAVGARWVERDSVLIGAYLGEVLREALGARWRELIGTPVGPDSYALILPDGNATHPIARAYDRLSGQSSELLSYYAARLIDELG